MCSLPGMFSPDIIIVVTSCMHVEIRYGPILHEDRILICNLFPIYGNSA